MKGLLDGSNWTYGIFFSRGGVLGAGSSERAFGEESRLRGAERMSYARIVVS